MPHSSTPSPRRRSAATSPPTSRPRNSKPKTVDLGGAPNAAAPKIVDAGSKRRALKKKKARQSNWLAWTAAGAVTVIVAGTAAGIWTELQTTQGRVAQKRATLADLNTQLESGKRRLQALASAGGKERVLVENGFIKPGERLLLFPKK